MTRITRRSLLTSAAASPLAIVSAKAAGSPQVVADACPDDQPAAHYFAPLWSPDGTGERHQDGVFPSRSAVREYNPDDRRPVKRFAFVPLNSAQRFLVVEVLGIPGEPMGCGVRATNYKRPIPSPSSLVQVPAEFEATSECLQDVDDFELHTRAGSLIECAERNATLLASVEHENKFRWCVIAEFGQPLPKVIISVDCASAGVMEAKRVTSYPIRPLRPSAAELKRYSITAPNHSKAA